jgi:hypothetical protein
MVFVIQMLFCGSFLMGHMIGAADLHLDLVRKSSDLPIKVAPDQLPGQTELVAGTKNINDDPAAQEERLRNYIDMLVQNVSLDTVDKDVVTDFRNKNLTKTIVSSLVTALPALGSYFSQNFIAEVSVGASIAIPVAVAIYFGVQTHMFSSLVAYKKNDALVPNQNQNLVARGEDALREIMKKNLEELLKNERFVLNENLKIPDDAVHRSGMKQSATGETVHLWNPANENVTIHESTGSDIQRLLFGIKDDKQSKLVVPPL